MASEDTDTPIEADPIMSLAEDLRANKSTHIKSIGKNVDEAKVSEGGYHIYGLFFIFMIMSIGQVMKRVSEWTGIPYTTLITATGLILGLIC